MKQNRKAIAYQVRIKMHGKWQTVEMMGSRKKILERNKHLEIKWLKAFMWEPKQSNP